MSTQQELERIEAARRLISARRGGSFVGYNDPELADLVEHEPDIRESSPGASGTKSGFLFGGKVYPSAQSAKNANLPPRNEDLRRN